jgi:c-di-GMP-binding flagellar brake protein YcgR
MRGADRVPWTDFYLGSVKAKCDQKVLSMVLADLSMTGIYLYSETALDVGKSVNLEFSLPGISGLLEIEGQVVRVTRMHKIKDKMNKGVAIQFTKFNGIAENTLSSFLNENKPESNFMHYYL